VFSSRSLETLGETLLENEKERAVMMYGSKSKADKYTKLRTNPTGCAAGHTGRAWLRTMLQDTGAPELFVQGAKDTSKMIDNTLCPNPS
jgi:hypothetical protein